MTSQAATSPLPSAEKSTNGRSVIRVPSALKIGFRLASAVSPELGAELARRIFFTPPRTPWRDEQQQILARAQQGELTLRRGRMRVYHWGEGPTVLLVHGWGGHAGQMTEFVAPLMRAGLRVVAIDGLGHGKSGGRLSSLVHFAEGIEAAARATGPLHGAIAHSLGAAGLVMAMKQGIAVRRAVFVSPQARLTGVWSHFRESLGMSDEVWRRLTAKSERWLKVRFADLHPADAAPRMTAPALILHGQADRISPVSEGETLAALWPGAQFRPLDAGHLSILRDWRAVLASAEFLKP